MRRPIAALASALIVLLLTATPSLAGGWAEIAPDASVATEPPVAGEPTEIGFTVLQHGETPAGWVNPTVTFTNPATGEEVRATASASGADGHFIATASLPSAGVWSWQVTMPELVTESASVAMSVLTASGEPVPFDPAVTMRAIELAKRDVQAAVLEQTGGQIEGLRAEVGTLQAETSRLGDQVDAITQERDALAARLTEAEAGSTDTPLIGFVLLAILAGAVAGFAMAWLGHRSTPDVRFSPAQQGSKPG